MNDKLIKISALRKKFQSRDVLSGIDIDVAKGEFVAIKGASGSGKSTLLSIIGLLEDYDKGEYLLNGSCVKSITEKQKSQIRNNTLGWIFQNFNLIGDMTVAENVALPLKYANVKCNKKECVNSVLAQVGLLDKYNAYPDQLSGGQQQRIAIARALITNPDLILADEPTGNLDSFNGKNIVEILKQLNKLGKTIILITHDDAVAQQAQRTIEITDGNIAC